WKCVGSPAGSALSGQKPVATPTPHCYAEGGRACEFVSAIVAAVHALEVAGHEVDAGVLKVSHRLPATERPRARERHVSEELRLRGTLSHNDQAGLRVRRIGEEYIAVEVLVCRNHVDPLRIALSDRLVW